MPFQFTPAAWRVGMVLLIYGILYLGSKEILPWWLAAFLLPLYMLLQPVTPEMLENHTKTHQDGMIFYIFKWSAVSIGIILVLVFIYTAWLSLPFLSAAKALLQNSFVTVPVILSVASAWLIRERAWLSYQQEKVRKEAAGKKRRSRKKK